MEEVCSFPPTKMPLPKPSSERTRASFSAMTRWMGKMIKADTDKCKFLDFMIAKAVEKCGNKLFYHNYQHMMDVVINSTILTCMWISEGRLGDYGANASDVLLSMALAAAFHDTVMEHRSAPGQSEELSAQFLRETYSLYLCLRPDLAANRFCADPVEVAYGLISYTVPNIRTELRSRLDAFPLPVSDQDSRHRLSLQLGAILADADVMESLCLPFKNAVGITRRVKKELWDHNIDAELTLRGFYSSVTPEGFISEPGQHLQEIFRYNRDLCVKRDLMPYS